MATMRLKNLPSDAPDLYGFAREAIKSQRIGANDAKDERMYSEAEKIDSRVTESVLKPKQYPQFWHCRGGVSDKNFVMSRMYYVPEKLKHQVSAEYERLFLTNGSDGRRLANTYLHDLAVKYKNNKG